MSNNLHQESWVKDRDWAIANQIFGARLHIRCQQPVLQMAFIRLAYLGGLTVSALDDDTIPLLTDDIAIPDGL